jgi:hypothetical protein
MAGGAGLGYVRVNEIPGGAVLKAGEVDVRIAGLMPHAG